MNHCPLVSITIKALNEEKYIAACLDAAVREAQTVNGEVVLVDSLSTDRTVAIAEQYPIRIVQFDNRSDCGCGAATQLGYQYARGEFVYVLDADMVIQPGFLVTALNILQTDATLAGVAGKVIDNQVLTLVDNRRIERVARQQQSEYVKDLGGGGLYRRAAIESAGGYLAHRGLDAFEESELGARLITNGWRLLRLNEVGVTHTGHTENNTQMLGRLWRSRRPHAIGVTLRSALGKQWWWSIYYAQWFVFVTVGFHGLALLISTLPSFTSTLFSSFILTDILLWLGALMGMSVRKGSVRVAFLSILLWHFNAAAALCGFFQRIIDPLIPIVAHELPSQLKSAVKLNK